MNLEASAQVATAIGALFAALTLASGFYFFRRRKIDEYASRFNGDMVLLRTRFDRMREILLTKYDFQDEIAAAIANNPRYDCLFGKLHRINKKRARPRTWDRYVDDYLSRIEITASTRSPATEEYEAWLNELAEMTARYKAQYPGLFWLLWSVHRVFEAAFMYYQSIARSEKGWTTELKKLGTRTYYSSGDIRAIFIYKLWRRLSVQEAQFEKDVGQLFEALDLVTRAYSRLPAAQLYRQRFKEREHAALQGGLEIKSKGDGHAITETLKQAKLAFAHVLDPSELVTYDRLIDGFQIRVEQREMADKLTD